MNSGDTNPCSSLDTHVQTRQQRALRARNSLKESSSIAVLVSADVIDRDERVTLSGPDARPNERRGTPTHPPHRGRAAPWVQWDFSPEPENIRGYAGVARFLLDGEEQLEFGYRLVPVARGRGDATEASMALLERARASFEGTIYGLVDPSNEASIAVITKIGFEYWERDLVDGALRNLYRWHADGIPTAVT